MDHRLIDSKTGYGGTDYTGGPKPSYENAGDPYPSGGVSYQSSNPYSQGGGPQDEGSFPPLDEEGHEVEPSAPPAGYMEQLPGYTNIGFDEAMLPPPSYDEATREPLPARESIRSTSTISNQDARDAILQHVSENCCYGKSPAVEMQFTNMVSSAAFHYTLETFAEARSTKWTCKPYRGESIIMTGPPPGPWDIQAQAPVMFKTSSLDIEVPNSAYVKPCYSCRARGFRRCTHCHGRGRTSCLSCHGSGRRSEYRDGRHQHSRCPFCQNGWKSCLSCHGCGRVTCQKCDGRASLRWFILLTIKWTNHLDDHIVERTALPDKLIRKVQGQTAFEETRPRVWPINHFPEQEINAASSNLVSRHGSEFNLERILLQRHRVRVVPVTEVFYSYKDKNSTFFVFGEEHKVYAPDYPAKCCCGCSIL